MKNYELEPHIMLKSGTAVTTSIDIAENFGKEHKNILAKIGVLKNKESEEMEKFGRLNFKLTSYLDEHNRRQPMYQITRDGFSFLVMGFTGKKANHWKLKYIAAFNAMEQVLTNQANNAWQELRQQGKATRLTETDTISQFIEYAQAQGSKNAKWYYATITKATYKALFLIKDQPGNASFRNMLDNMQLSFLQTAEYVASNALRDGMAEGMFYRDIFQLAKSRVGAFASTVGVTDVIVRTHQLRIEKAAA